MKYTITEVFEDRKRYLDLLLLGDEQEDMIDRYLERGRMFVLEDDGVKCSAVVVELNDCECELKNIATYPGEWGKGYGRAMMGYLLRLFLARYETMYVGTGETPKTIRFYEQCGFRFSHRVPDFFIDNYTSPVIDCGVRLVDMIYLKCSRSDCTFDMDYRSSSPE